MFFFILDGGFKEVFAVLFSFVFVDDLGGFLFLFFLSLFYTIIPLQLFLSFSDLLLSYPFIYLLHRFCFCATLFPREVGGRHGDGSGMGK